MSDDKTKPEESVTPSEEKKVIKPGTQLDLLDLIKEIEEEKK
jgi:hypothetical protein